LSIFCFCSLFFWCRSQEFIAMTDIVKICLLFSSRNLRFSRYLFIYSLWYRELNTGPHGASCSSTLPLESTPESFFLTFVFQVGSLANRAQTGCELQSSYFCLLPPPNWDYRYELLCPVCFWDRCPLTFCLGCPGTTILQHLPPE
jgi:hypothetical protein